MLVNPAQATGSGDHIHQNREANHVSIKCNHIEIVLCYLSKCSHIKYTHCYLSICNHIVIMLY